ncbi:helix-turn-helix domain-containing protein [Mycobacterium colombiense]
MPSSQCRPALTAREAQAALGLECVDTVYRLIRRGELRALRVGRHRYRIRPEDLDAYLAGQKANDDDAAVDEWVERALAVAPKLTEAQRNKLAELLRPVRHRPEAMA